MKLTPAVIEIVVADMAAALAFYRRLGLDIAPEADAEPHVDVDLGGIHLAFDTRETILSFNTSWTPPSGGHGMALAFSCESPAEVDAAYAELTAAEGKRRQGAVGRLLGHALRDRARPGRQPGRPVRAARLSDESSPAGLVSSVISR